jgi:formylmethanofuran dehydrogenase subunit E
MYRTDDPIADFERWDAEQQECIEKSPVCSNCGKHVMDDHYYLIDDENFCPDCLENEFRREID